jgi:hypothetical protein
LIDWDNETGLIAIPLAAVSIAAAVSTPTTTAAAAAIAPSATAATATAISTTATAAAVTATAAATAATTAAETFLRSRFVDRQRAAAELLAVERIDGCFGFAVGRHFNKAKPFALAGLAIADDLGRGDLAVLAEHFLQLRTIDTVGQITDV